MKTEEKKINEAFRKACFEIGTQTAMAKRLGVTKQYVNQIVKGQCKLGFKYVRLVAEMTSLSREELRPDIYG